MYVQSICSIYEINGDRILTQKIGNVLILERDSCLIRIEALPPARGWQPGWQGKSQRTAQRRQKRQ
jgi:hypothetical protein